MQIQIQVTKEQVGFRTFELIQLLIFFLIKSSERTSRQIFIVSGKCATAMFDLRQNYSVEIHALREYIVYIVYTVYYTDVY